jgi:hypothetical protein
MDLGPLQRITERLWCGQARIMELEPARSGSYRKTAKNVFPYLPPRQHAKFPNWAGVTAVTGASCVFWTRALEMARIQADAHEWHEPRDRLTRRKARPDGEMG